MDVFTKSKRSSVMAAIRGRGNRSTERTFAALLRRSHLRGWTLHSRGVVGRPDFYFEERRVAVFVDGCFWHGCPRCFKAPKQNAAFWALKIGKNRERDRSVGRILRRQGIRVMRIWEHDVEARSKRLEKVLNMLRTPV
jgi:DNA mismatch endonuclease (patch repair protein)